MRKTVTPEKPRVDSWQMAKGTKLALVCVAVKSEFFRALSVCLLCPAMLHVVLSNNCLISDRQSLLLITETEIVLRAIVGPHFVKRHVRVSRHVLTTSLALTTTGACPD